MTATPEQMTSTEAREQARVALNDYHDTLRDECDAAPDKTVEQHLRASIVQVESAQRVLWFR